MAKPPAQQAPAWQDIKTALSGGKNVAQPTFTDKVVDAYCDAQLAILRNKGAREVASHAMRELCELDEERERLAGNNAMRQRICVDIEITCIETVGRIQRELYDPWSLT